MVIGKLKATYIHILFRSSLSGKPNLLPKIFRNLYVSISYYLGSQMNKIIKTKHIIHQ